MSDKMYARMLYTDNNDIQPYWVSRRDPHTGELISYLVNYPTENTSRLQRDPKTGHSIRNSHRNM